MDVPITKPSMVSYADDLDIAQLLENLLKEKHNGFMRITADEDEGFIIFKDGRQKINQTDTNIHTFFCIAGRLFTDWATREDKIYTQILIYIYIYIYIL